MRRIVGPSGHRVGMVELVGFRYAVGPSTAKWMWAATSLAIIAYSLFVAMLALMEVGPRSWTWISTMVALLNALATMFLAGFIIVGGGLVATFCTVDKQRVEGLPPVRDVRWRRAWRGLKHSDTVAFLRSGAGPAAMILWSILYVARRDWAPSEWPRALLAVTISAVVAAHALALIRSARWIWSQTTRLTRGEIDLYRGFDWHRMDSLDDVGRFRQLYRNRRWRPPSLITEPRYADRLASQARMWRLAWLMVSAGAGLVAVAFAAGPLREILSAVVEGFAHLDRPPPKALDGLGQKALFLFWFGLITLPVVLQQHVAASLDSLGKLYDARAAELRHKRHLDRLGARAPRTRPSPRSVPTTPVPAQPGS
jgi:hypothetical protein